MVRKMNDNNKMDRSNDKANQKKMTPRQKQKRNRKATLAAVLCFVAAIAIVGTYTMRDYKTVKKEGELAKAQLEEQRKALEESSQEASGDAQKEENISDDAGNSGNTGKKDSGTETGTSGETGRTSNTDEKSEDNGDSADGNQNNGSQQTARTAGKASSANFTSDSKMIWPVNGTVLMNYSMDKTVYFATLDQYKYNPALIIGGAEGDQVLCGAPGVIKSIDVTAQTGTTVTVDLGNGYEVLYGQLKEVPVKVGDQVEAKSILGYVGQPTKYYSVEGCNVYMELRKDGTPVNPVDYMTKR